MKEQDLLKHLAELPREISPASDPWPRIAARIDQSLPGRGSDARPQRRIWLAAAASLVLAVFAGLLLKPALNEGPMPSGQADDLLADNGPPPGAVYAVDVEYQAAFREFISIGDSQRGLNAQTMEKLESTWTDLRVTETALAEALQMNPGDPFLNERMLELRARQLGFLKQLVALDRNNRRLTI
ncbi:hypothetical protein ACFL07_02620 [Pseudomonadota bacterium]